VNALDFETVPAPCAGVPAWALPPDACDAHFHVFGPHDRFRPTARPVYALPEATPQVAAALRRTLCLTRGVLVQPAPYGNNPEAMLSAIADAPDVLRGIAVADPGIDTGTLERWRAAGSVGFDAIAVLAPRMRLVGLHAQLWARANELAGWLPHLLRANVPLVLDHMACPDPLHRSDAAAFNSILARLADSEVWAKLTICRVSEQAGHDDARAFHDALIAAAPERVVWGSDWPYVRMNPAPDAGQMLDLLHRWVPDPAQRTRILVDNPARLYGFERTAP
jgi:2-pyrone-4,6-dicarboxylate lactonase